MPPAARAKAAATRSSIPVNDHQLVRMAAKLKHTMNDNKVKDMPPMNGEYFLKLTELYSYIFSQAGLEDLSTSPTWGAGREEVATKSFHKPAPLKKLIQDSGVAETAFNGLSLNPFWTPVRNVPYNKGNVERLKATYLKDKHQFNSVKFICLCPDNDYDPSAALGDIKVVSPLEPLHAAVSAFVEEHRVGMSDQSYQDWLKLLRSVTCEFKVISNKEDLAANRFNT